MKVSLARATLLFSFVPLVLGNPAAIKNSDSLDEVVGINTQKDPIPKIGIEGNRDSAEKQIKKKNTEEKIEAEEIEDDAKKEVVDVDLPEELTLSTFDQSTSEQLSFVEFYSPYCSHCKALAPTWEATVKEFSPEMKELKIQMRQVNCIESGDLCDREDVNSFPNLRLYVPDRDKDTGDLVSGKLRFVGSFPRSIMRTTDNFKKYMKNSVAEYDSGAIDLPSSSTLLTVDDVLKLAVGNADESHFVTFFPATDKHWQTSETESKNLFPRNCIDCFEDKQIWGKLSNQILSTVKTGHVNCHSNPNLCEKMGFKDLTSPGRREIPRCAMFLPNSTGIIRFDYEDEFSLDKLKSFAIRLHENSQYEKISAATLSELMEYRNNLPFEPLNSYYPLSNKVSIVFYYDEEKVTDEDRAILPYLLEYVTKSPFNINLFTAKNKKFEKNVNTQAENLVEFINYNENAERKKFNKAMYLATTLTSKPTILVYKDNTLFTSIYQNFAPEDMRNFGKIEEFVKKNQYPLYQELTPDLLPHYFDGAQKTADKVVVTFIDSENARITNQALYNMSLIAHDYYYSKKQYYFNDMMKRREVKSEKVKQLQQQNADSIKVIKEMRKEVPHFFDNNEVLFTFVDVSNNAEFAKVLGWDISKKNYKPGDAIIVSKDNTQYWDTNIFGQLLTNDPYELKPVLDYLLDPELLFGKVHERDVRLTHKLVGSPYNDTLRFMDTVHRHGFFGYVFLIIAIYVMVSGVRRFIVKRKRAAPRLNPGVGILGNLAKKD